MENKVLEILEKIKKYGVCYNGTVNITEIIDLIEWQKAEIERLTIQVKSYKMSDLLKQAYIDQLKEENKELVSAKVFELETKNAELQKQVDELKGERGKEILTSWVYRDGFNDGRTSSAEERALMRDTIINLKVENQQAVKDTAKNIVNRIDEELCKLQRIYFTGLKAIWTQWRK